MKTAWGSRKCIDCNDEFGVYNALQSRCGPCQARYRNRRLKKYTLPCNRCGTQFHPRDNRTKTCHDCRKAFPCKICGKKTKRTSTNTLYCSTRCSYHAKLVAKHGDENYLGALRRDSFKCRACGDGKGHLHVHHIDGQGLGYPKRLRNNGIDNLVTLCNPCHGNLHAITGRTLYARHMATVLEVFKGFIQPALPTPKSHPRS